MNSPTANPSCNGDPAPAPAPGSAPERGVDVVVDVAVVALWRRAACGSRELLIARRYAKAIRGGLWELPGGKVEAGESAAQAALREVEEEVGLGTSALESTPEPLAVAEHADPSLSCERSVRLHAFLVEVKQGVEAAPLGTSEVRWIDPDRIGDFEWPPANQPINEAIQRALARRG